jgi:hypothetical protein
MENLQKLLFGRDGLGSTSRIGRPSGPPNGPIVPWASRVASDNSPSPRALIGELLAKSEDYAVSRRTPSLSTQITARRIRSLSFGGYARSSQQSRALKTKGASIGSAFRISRVMMPAGNPAENHSE